MEKLADGRYGLCERCGHPIDAERLDALPAARFCLRDEERYELGGAHLEDLAGSGSVVPRWDVGGLTDFLADDDDTAGVEEPSGEEAAVSARPEE